MTTINNLQQNLEINIRCSVCQKTFGVEDSEAHVAYHRQLNARKKNARISSNRQKIKGGRSRKRRNQSMGATTSFNEHSPFISIEKSFQMESDLSMDLSKYSTEYLQHRQSELEHQQGFTPRKVFNGLKEESNHNLGAILKTAARQRQPELHPHIPRYQKTQPQKKRIIHRNMLGRITGDSWHNNGQALTPKLPKNNDRPFHFSE